MKRPSLAMLLAAFTVVAFGVTGVAVAVILDRVDLRKVEAACEEEYVDVISVGDGGDTIAVSGSEQPDDVNRAAACVLRELGAPDSVTAKIRATTAMQGRQSESWSGWDVSWTYHPDQGAQLVIERD